MKKRIRNFFKAAVSLSIAAALSSAGGSATYAAAAASVSGNPAFAGDSRSSRSLTALWKEYSSVAEKNLPRKESDILMKIMETSAGKGKEWDFFDASVKYVRAVSRRNWKDLPEARERVLELAGRTGSPVLLYNLSCEPLMDFDYEPGKEEFSSDLAGRRTPEFYRNDRYLASGYPFRIPEAFTEYIDNDLEYLIWSALVKSVTERNSGRTEFLARMAEDIFRDRYPESPVMEMLLTSDFTAVSEKWEGTAMSFIARAMLLSEEFEEAGRDNAGTAVYEKLRKDCDELIGVRASLRKKEAELAADCRIPEDLASVMDGRSVVSRVENDTLTFIVQNIPWLDVKIADTSGTVIFGRKVADVRNRYYVKDTVLVEIPSIDDGIYNVSASYEDVELSFKMKKFSISSALRYSAGKAEFYLADYITGRPYEKASVSVYLRGEPVWTMDSLELDGFTEFPASLKSRVNEDSRYTVVFSAKDGDGRFRRSRDLYFNPFRYFVEEKSEDDTATVTVRATVLKDRAALNPGETVRFKVVTGKYSGRDGEIPSGTVDKGLALKAVLRDPEGRQVDEQDMVTNDFGSAAGSFLLPSGYKNGTWSIGIFNGKTELANTLLTVDEFVLPSFGIEFEPDGQIWFPGDTVTVKGRLVSFSGKPLNSAVSRFSVEEWGKTVLSGRLEPDDDGSFSIKFRAGETSDVPEWHCFSVKVRCTDGTGETAEAFSTVIVHDYGFDVGLVNEADGETELPDGKDRRPSLLGGDFAILEAVVSTPSYVNFRTDVAYELLDSEGNVLSAGEAVSGERFSVDFSSLPSGLYEISAKVSVKGRSKTSTCKILKVEDGDDCLPVRLENYFKPVTSPAGTVGFRFGASDGPVWAVLQLSAPGRRVIWSDTVWLEGVAGQRGSLADFRLDSLNLEGTSCLLDILYFRKGRVYRFSHLFDMRRKTGEVPLALNSLPERIWSGDTLKLDVLSVPGMECAISVYDKASEVFRPNWWGTVSPMAVSPEFAYISTFEGRMSGYGFSRSGYPAEEAIPFSMAENRPVFSMKAEAADAGTAPDMKSSPAPVPEDNSVRVRKKFSDVLAFIPFLRTDENGKATFSFRAGDNLSTYYVSVFAHNRNLENAYMRGKFEISLPIRLSLKVPRYLYDGDEYVLSYTLSNITEDDSDGIVSLSVYDGTDYAVKTPSIVMTSPVSVPAGRSVNGKFRVDTDLVTDTLGLKLVYSSYSGMSDAVFEMIPVKPASARITESCSSVLLPGVDRDSLISVLMSRFVNTSPYGAEVREYSLHDKLMEAVPEPSSIISSMSELSDAVSVSSSFLSFCISRRLYGRPDMSGSPAGTEDSLFVDALKEFRNSDGGISWLRGGASSPVITAAVLENIAAALSVYGSTDETVLMFSDLCSGAVQYLDDCHFEENEPSSGIAGLGFAKYFRVRSEFAEVPFVRQLSRQSKKEFEADCREFFIGEESRGILDLARCISVYGNLKNISEKYGRKIPESSFTAMTKTKFSGKTEKSVMAMVESLKEYAVNHSSGGFYYPNAVMPFRGLLESELYAHTLIASVLSPYDASLADGIRLWMMVQKDSQDWTSDPAYMMAMLSVEESAGGSEGNMSGLSSARMVTVSKSFIKPFADTEASGNGMSVDCRYFRERRAGEENFPETEDVPDGFVPVESGMRLVPGDRVIAEYRIRSEENRSYVIMNTPFPASFIPENQLSGFSAAFRRYGLPAGPSYREVKTGECRWYFDVLPEETTVVRDSFTITQEGRFTAPVVSVESLYAPHYRANGSFCSAGSSR